MEYLHYLKAYFGILVLCCFLSGCGGGGGGSIPSSVFSQYVDSGPEEYRLGYAAGCKDAIVALEGGTPEPKGRVSKIYNNGWVRGNAICTEEGVNYLQSRVKQDYTPAATRAEEEERQMIWQDLKK